MGWVRKNTHSVVYSRGLGINFLIGHHRPARPPPPPPSRTARWVKNETFSIIVTWERTFWLHSKTYGMARWRIFFFIFYFNNFINFSLFKRKKRKFVQSWETEEGGEGTQQRGWQHPASRRHRRYTEWKKTGTHRRTTHKTVAAQSWQAELRVVCVCVRQPRVQSHLCPQEDRRTIQSFAHRERERSLPYSCNQVV